MDFNGIYVDSKKIDPKVLNEYLNALEKIFIKYPNLKNRIDYIGPLKGFFNEITSLLKNVYDYNYKYSLKEKNEIYNSTFVVTCPLSDPHDPFEETNFIIMGINERLNYYKTYLKLYKVHNKNFLYAQNIEELLYHEVGHMFSYLFNLLKSDDVITNIYMLMSKKDGLYSDYSLNSFEEFIAEHFSKYLVEPHYNKATEYIGYIINDLYKLHEDTSLFTKTNKRTLSK